eukprot:SAG22_NODE_6300_length_872_cov_0.952196_2_plen_123_part_01
MTDFSTFPDSRFVRRGTGLLALPFTGMPAQSSTAGQDMPDTYTVISNDRTSGSIQYNQSADSMDGHFIIIQSSDLSDNLMVSGGHFVHNDNVNLDLDIIADDGNGMGIESVKHCEVEDKRFKP